MAVSLKSNNLLKWVSISIIAVIALAMGQALFFKKTVASDKNTTSQEPVYSTTRPIVDEVSSDTAAESLNSVAAALHRVEQQMDLLKQENSLLQQEKRTLMREVENNINRIVNDKMRGLDNLTLNRLKQEFESLQQNLVIYPNQDESDNESSAIGNDKRLGVVNDLSPSRSNLSLPDVGVDVTHSTVGSTANRIKADKDESESIPYYTIPANGTAINTTLLTAIVGRVPFKGRVTEPYPFKLILGQDVLTANGYNLPNVAGMIVSGFATGELVTKSARGWVTSVTFVFPDGTIQLVESDTKGSTRNFTHENSLGYLSDEYGNPFISGKLITNAPQIIGVTTALGAAKGAASAFAQSEISNQDNLFGGYNSRVTGNTGRYVLGRAGEDAASEVMQWWKDRIESSFDVIYVSPVDSKTNKPRRIAIHFTQNIPIDYNINARKLRYGQQYHSLNVSDLD